MLNSYYYPSLSTFTKQQCDEIHFAALETLRKTGVRVYEEEALSLLKNAGAVVEDENLVKIPSSLVEWALRQPPSRVGLCRRESNVVTVELAGDNVNYGPGSDCPNYLDPKTGERRLFSQKDQIDCIKLVDAVPELGFVMSMGIPWDLTEGKTHNTGNVYQYQFATLLENTEKPIVFVADTKADCEAIAAMAAATNGKNGDLFLNPNLLLYSEPSTPLRHSKTATEKLLFMAEHQLPITHSPAPMMGGTAPLSIAGGMVLANAEILSSIVMHQLKKPGAPFVYGSGLHHMDMSTTISVYGAPEFQLARLSVASMGKYYNLPTWGYAGHTDSCVVDEQAAADAVFSVMVAELSRTNLIHDVGYTEGGLATSPEMIVLTAETISMVRHFSKGIEFNRETLAEEIIHRVGPGGDFLTDDSTLENFRQLWQPRLFDRRRYEMWKMEGEKRVKDRLKEKTVSLIEEHQPKQLADSIKDEIAYILKQDS